MGEKPKVAIVAGELQYPRILRTFEPLRAEFDVTVYALSDKRLLERHGTGLRLRVFENLPDMPGYMRGLEEELISSDFILGFETSRLSTFQAVRAARKFGMPLGVLVNEFHPFFYDRYTNIRAIQFDICHKAERFWVTSEAAATTLALDRVPREMVRYLKPSVDLGRFRPCEERRRKFRRYLGIAPDELIVLFQQDLEAWNRPEELVKALAALRKQAGIDSSKIRMILAGTGSQAMELKYRAFDMGLGRQVMFLHQDPEPFLVDLYAASDVYFVPRPLRAEFHEEFPFPLLEAMAVGVTPLVGAGSVAEELAGEAAHIYSEDTSQFLAAALFTLASQPALRERLGQAARQRIENVHAEECGQDALAQEIKAILAAKAAESIVANDPSAIFDAVRGDLERGAERDALCKLEEAQLLDLKSSLAKAELYSLRGDAFYGLGDFEKAMQSYSEGLRHDERNHCCLRGLGFVAWQGHSNEEALIFFRKAHAVNDRDPETMLGIGLVYRRLGLTEDALFWLEKCVLCEDPPPSALVAVAQTCAQLNDAAQGIKTLERVIEAVGENHTLMVTLGQLYVNEGMTAEGQAILQKALGGTDNPAA